jgi:hypothetical protein
MSFGMRNGSFTGVRRSDIIVGSQYAYLNARRIVNGNDRAELIQSYLKTPKTLLKRPAQEKVRGTHQHRHRQRSRRERA